MLQPCLFSIHLQEPGQLAQAITSSYHEYYIRKKSCLFGQILNIFYRKRCTQYLNFTMHHSFTIIMINKYLSTGSMIYSGQVQISGDTKQSV